MTNKLNIPNKLKYLLPPVISRHLNSIKSFYEFIPYINLIKKNNKFKDIHKGKRCFILGSGPSVNEFDLTKLKDEIVIGLNSFYIHPQYKEIFSNSAPKYMLTSPLHGPKDAWPEERWKEMFEEHEAYITKNSTLFYGLGSHKPEAKSIIEKYNLLDGFDVNYYFTSVVQDEWYLPKAKHFDFSKNLITASTSSVWGILLALHMGFDEIYLIGVDNNNICLPRDNPRFIRGGTGHEGEVAITESGTFSWNYFTSFHLARTLKQYEFMNMLNKNTIHNCSKSSMADMFSFVEYSTIFNSKKN